MLITFDQKSNAQDRKSWSDSSNAWCTRKMNFTFYVLGFGLVSGVAKVFPVSSVSLARKSSSTTRPDDEMGSQIGHVTSRRGQDMYTTDREERPRDQFEIQFRHQVASCVVDFPADERELTGKTFTIPLTCTSPNPNMYVKFIFPWSSPLKFEEQSLPIKPHRAISNDQSNFREVFSLGHTSVIIKAGSPPPP